MQRIVDWLFVGSLYTGQRAAEVMSLMHSARLNGHDVYAFMKDVLDRLPSLSASRIRELLPPCWVSASLARFHHWASISIVKMTWPETYVLSARIQLCSIKMT